MLLLTEFIDTQADGLESLVEHAPAEFDRLIVLQVLEEAANGGAGLAGDDEVEPGGVGPGIGSGDDLYSLAVEQLGR